MPAATYWELIEPYWDSLPIYDDPSTFLAAAASLPLVVRHLLCAHWAQSEVCNGGFHQFFHNSTGILAPEALEGLTAIGMPQTADLLRRAMALLGSEYPRDRATRIGLLEAADSPDTLIDRLEALERPFFKLIAAEQGGWPTAPDAYAATVK